MSEGPLGIFVTLFTVFTFSFRVLFEVLPTFLMFLSELKGGCYFTFFCGTPCISRSTIVSWSMSPEGEVFCVWYHNAVTLLCAWGVFSLSLTFQIWIFVVGKMSKISWSGQGEFNELAPTVMLLMLFFTSKQKCAAPPLKILPDFNKISGRKDGSDGSHPFFKISAIFRSRWKRL